MLEFHQLISQVFVVVSKLECSASDYNFKPKFDFEELLGQWLISKVFQQLISQVFVDGFGLVIWLWKAIEVVLVVVHQQSIELASVFHDEQKRTETLVVKFIKIKKLKLDVPTKNGIEREAVVGLSHVRSIQKGRRVIYNRSLVYQSP